MSAWNNQKGIRLLLTGGGTGGHLFPAVATAQEFCRQYPDTEVLFVGTKRKVDSTSLENYGFTRKSILSYGLKGKSLLQLAKALAVLPISLLQAAGIIFFFKPDIIFGVGGYVTGPVVAAGKLLGVATVIHEQNSVPGLANKKLAKLAGRICLSLPVASDHFPAEKTILTGNPVRAAILELAKAKRLLDKEENLKQAVVVLGGSQGASALNTLMPEALRRLGEKRELPLIIHQTGARDLERVRMKYQELGIEARVEPFFVEMEEIYRQAAIVVSRAGATTLSELAVLAIPAILLPYPHAADAHQEKNAAYYVRGGGALQFSEKEVDGARLASELELLLADPSRLATMGRAMEKLALPKAAEDIVSCCLLQIPEDKG